ncbi:hypothetical protein G7046_g4091 [Stylonectria norvegica]|nr:hypothetical protein G7046_g4091 [Stylonectria norvegica]
MTLQEDYTSAKTFSTPEMNRVRHLLERLRLCTESKTSFEDKESNTSFEDKESKTSFEGKKKLHDLPKEIPLCITDYLPGAGAAALALSNRHLLNIFGTDVLKLHDDEKFALLQLIEKDGHFLSKILCRQCLAFHNPRLTDPHLIPSWTTAEGHRACVKFGDKDTADQRQSPYLPPEVIFDVVSAVTKSQRLNSGLHGVDALKSARFWVTGRGPFMWVEVSAQVVKGHLLLKTETVVYPGRPRGSALHSVAPLLAFLNSVDILGRCCGHVKWADLHRFVFNVEIDSLEKHVCLWNHGEACMHATATAGCLGEAQREINNMKGCPCCPTDMVMTSRNMLDGSTAIVLTSWKDLGEGVHTDDKWWQSHLRHSGFDSLNRDLELGTIAASDDNRVEISPMGLRDANFRPGIFCGDPIHRAGHADPPRADCPYILRAGSNRATPLFPAFSGRRTPPAPLLPFPPSCRPRTNGVLLTLKFAGLFATRPDEVQEGGSAGEQALFEISTVIAKALVAQSILTQGRRGEERPSDQQIMLD